MLKNPITLFIALFIVLGILFFTLPINLFDGVIEYQRGLQEMKLERPLSLSYFVGMGMNEGDLDYVKDFYLVPKGWAMVVIFWVGIPALLAYRVHLKNKDSKSVS